MQRLAISQSDYVLQARRTSAAPVARKIIEHLVKALHSPMKAVMTGDDVEWCARDSSSAVGRGAFCC